MTAASEKAARPLVMRGSRGQGVKTLQQRLNARGQEPPLAVDGIFGPLTEAAVVDFQTARDLDPDGKAGKDTWKAIEDEAGTREIDSDEASLGAHAVKRMDENNVNPHTLDRGVHYHYNYKDLCVKEGRPDLWKDDYRAGYADPTHFERIGWMDWRLKPRMSASAAIESWLRGLTIAECNSAIVAIEIDSLRSAMSDTKFDAHFGSTDKVIPKDKRLRVKQGFAGTPVEGMATTTEASLAGTEGTKGKRPAKPGEKYYFYNHPKYLLKHPGGAWQGENALYMGEDPSTGEQLWSGMGADRKTEDQLLTEMLGAYNADRDEEDERKLKERFPAGAPSEYDPANGKFPEKLKSPEEILTEPPYKLDDETRKGGFVPDSGMKLDAAKVQALADE